MRAELSGRDARALGRPRAADVRAGPRPRPPGARAGVAGPASDARRAGRRRRRRGGPEGGHRRPGRSRRRRGGRPGRAGRGPGGRPAAPGRGRRRDAGTGGGAGRAGGRDRAGARAARPRPRGGGRRRAGRGAGRGRARGGRTGPRGRRRGAAPPGPAHRRRRAGPRRARRAAPRRRPGREAATTATARLSPRTVALSVLRGAYAQACAAYAAAEVGADLSGAARRWPSGTPAPRRVSSTRSTPAARAAAEALLHSPDAADPAARRAAADQARVELARADDRRQQAATATALARRELAGFTADAARRWRPTASRRARRTARSGSSAPSRTAAPPRTPPPMPPGSRATPSGARRRRRVRGGLRARRPRPRRAGQAPIAAAEDRRPVRRGRRRRGGGHGRRPGRARRRRGRAGARRARGPRRRRRRGPVRAGTPVRHAHQPRAQAHQRGGAHRHARAGGRLGGGPASPAAFAGGRPREHRPPPRRDRRPAWAAWSGRPCARCGSPSGSPSCPTASRDWSGQQFLRIRFDDLDEAALRHALGEVVDRTAEQQVAGKSAGRGATAWRCCCAGVRAAMPKGVRVEMLKPDAVLRTERLRVAQIRDVFSGGQRLTAAIVLYCTMAALRAHQRGHGRRPHAGVLFLDNPIGRASAGYLLELQFGVARALGVQLVYTTGLFDAGALNAFPLDHPAAQRRRPAGGPQVPLGRRPDRARRSTPSPSPTAPVASPRPGVFRRPASRSTPYGRHGLAMAWVRLAPISADVDRLQVAPGAARPEQPDVERHDDHGRRHDREHRDRPERGEHRQQDERQQRVRQPRERVGAARRRGAQPGREDLRLVDVERVGEHVADHGVEEAEDHDRGGRVGEAEEQPEHRHPEPGRHEQDLALHPFDQRQRQQRPDRVAEERQRREPQRLHDGEALGHEHERHQRAEAVVAEALQQVEHRHHRGALAERRDQQLAERPAVAQRRGVHRVGLGQLGRGHVGLEPAHDRVGLLAPAVRGQPARRLRQRAAQQRDHDGAERADHEHPPPALDAQRGDRRQAAGEEPGRGHAEEADRVGPRDVAAAIAGRQQVAQVGVGDRRFGADADAREEAGDHQHGGPGAERREQRERRVDAEAEQERAPPAQPVGDPAERDGADEHPDERRRQQQRDHALVRA